MSDHDSLLLAVYKNPQCVTTRSAYVDILRERREHERADMVDSHVPCPCVVVSGIIIESRGDCPSCAGTRWVPRCEEPGCQEHGTYCESPGDDPENRDGDYFCTEHAAENGYCPLCGSFWGGIESFEMSGFCDNCRDQIENDTDDTDDTDDDRYYNELDGDWE